MTGPHQLRYSMLMSLHTSKQNSKAQVPSVKVWIMRSTLRSHVLVSFLALPTIGFSLLRYLGVSQCYSKMTCFKKKWQKNLISSEREAKQDFPFSPLGFQLVRFLSSWRTLVISSSVQSHASFNHNKIASLLIFFYRYLIIARTVYWWNLIIRFIKHLLHSEHCTNLFHIRSLFDSLY